VSSSTANKLVLAFAAGGIVMALFTGPTDGASRYRKIWGVTLLSAAGAALADFVPALVGPFFALIIFAYASGHLGGISKVTSTLSSKAGVNLQNPGGLQTL
jgi:hypothetical protein